MLEPNVRIQFPTMLEPNIRIQVAAIVMASFYLWAVVSALRRSRMSVRQSLLWLASGGVLLALSVYPRPVLGLATWMGFIAPSNAVFVGWLLLLTTLVFYQSLTTSIQSSQIKTLAQELAVMKSGGKSFEPEGNMTSRPQRHEP